MRYVRILGLCAIAACAVAALSVSSASALEWGKCEAKAGGKFANSNCTKKAASKSVGKFEFLSAKMLGSKRVSEGKSANVPFTGENLPETEIKLTSGLRECEFPKESNMYSQQSRKACAESGREGTNEAKLFVECATEHDTGETEAPRNLANVHVVFTGCKALGILPCASEGKAEGEVETNALKGQLGFINKAKHKVGVLLEPAAKGGLFASLVCFSEGKAVLGTNVGGGNTKTGAEYTKSGCFGACPGTKPSEETGGGDGIISPITPVNTMTSQYAQNYTEEENYPFKNVPSSLEKGPLKVLESFLVIEENGNISDWSGAGQVVSVQNTSEEEGEIKA